jgi:hypothetical protein
MDERAAREPSPASAFLDAPVERVILLPVLVNGQRVSVRIRAVDVPELAAVLEVSRGAKGDVEPGSKAARMSSLPVREVARLGIVSPAFAFDAPAPGVPLFDALAWGNRIAIMKGIMELSGVTRDLID